LLAGFSFWTTAGVLFDAYAAHTQHLSIARIATAYLRTAEAL
jgi:hypothetical protein